MALVSARGGHRQVRSVHFFAPQVAQRTRRATSKSFASQPMMWAIRLGVVRLSRRHDPHFRIRRYWRTHR
jgi:hypothetical protein